MSREVLMHGRKTADKKTLVLIALTSGFIGSFSSFSTLVAEILAQTLDILNQGAQLPNHAYGVMEFFSVVLTQTDVSMVGYHLGSALAATLTTPGLGYRQKRAGPARFVRSLECFSRFHLAKLNARSWFPVGTFTTNLSACILLAVINVLTHGATRVGPPVVNSQLPLDVLQGLGSGFCGSYSTLGTSINEIVALKSEARRAAYYYASLVSTFLAMLLIMGCYSWTNGLGAH
ncbi:uncharacterized protein OGAPODRAFT_8169 [Ogataea polymorpha]|uniref:uncharacterized protein n=1 Tax=Ogataea polymorpha TaxID=460523 RepID=UPI0007F459DF|nr:uncharacterized protein OGAPODRAFT_8169 [Ogataea polymorpha]OBA16926.1 hypothetical protein OGAPODRAFT_8169 [Ogataea polymorpha]